MEPDHYRFWPPGLPHDMPLPQTSLYGNLEATAARFPDKTAVVYYDTPLSYRAFKQDVDALAGFLQRRAGVKRGDRVLLDLQNSPQWVLAYYGILRADAVVVPVNPMNKTGELRHYVADAGAKVAFVAQDLLEQMQPLVGGPEGLERVIVATYSDHLTAATDLQVPDFVAAPRLPLRGDGLVAWADMLAAAREPGPSGRDLTPCRR